MVRFQSAFWSTRILIVEPDPIYRRLFAIWIRNHFGARGVQVTAAAGAAEAQAAAWRMHPHVLLTALELGGQTDGLDLACRLRKRCGEMQAIVVSQSSYAPLAPRLANALHTQFLAKPVGERTFVQAMEDALRRRPCHA